MEKKDRSKWIVIGVMVLIIVSVTLTGFLIYRLAYNTGSGAVTEAVNGDDGTTGVLKDANIVSNSDGEIIVYYNDTYYRASGTTETGYTGACDIYLTDGRISKIVTKSDAAGDTDEVYKVTSSSAASDVIRVLLKNNSAYTYSSLYIKCDSKCTVDGSSIKAKKVISAAKYLKDADEGTEIRLTAQSGGKFYICSKAGKTKTEGYEGDFILRKYGKGYVLINEIDIETYLSYVLPSEMPVSFSYEALKAQAVCARTFAYSQIGSESYAAYGADLDDSTSSQVYHSAEPSDITDKAIEETRGEVLTCDGETVVCYYYSTSPGYTEDLEVWNASSPSYLVAENTTAEDTADLSKTSVFHDFITRAVESYDDESPFYRWTAKLSTKLGMDSQYGRLKSLEVNERSSSGFVSSLTMVFEEGEKTYDREDDIRYALGKYLSVLKLSDGTKRKDMSVLPSACFEIESTGDNNIVLAGGGYGHGIGLSQYGADAMGDDGKSYTEILEFYYKGAKVIDIYS